MTDLELDRALAVAIGWPHVTFFAGKESGIYVADHRGSFRRFSHKDLAVAFAVAEKFDCFPAQSGGWWAAACNGSEWQYTDTPQRAIALAVVEAHRRGVLCSN